MARTKTTSPFVISVPTLQVAHQAIGDIKARNAQQAITLANSLLDIEAALKAAGQQPAPASEPEVKEPAKQAKKRR
jgi:hypothetical protein